MTALEKTFACSIRFIGSAGGHMETSEELRNSIASRLGAVA
jgi:hypothetical protein